MKKAILAVMLVFVTSVAMAAGSTLIVERAWTAGGNQAITSHVYKVRYMDDATCTAQALLLNGKTTNIPIGGAGTFTYTLARCTGEDYTVQY